MRSYLALRGKSPRSLFVFPGGTPVTKSFFSSQLRKSLAWAGMSTLCYKGHSFRIGAATTAGMQGVSEKEIQRMGRWKSQAFNIRNIFVFRCFIYSDSQLRGLI
ncbi:hypothetical protein NP493_382g01009 [Ridgeia piscesae]|uniref:Tyr recombinase domain-containing protein n=1 Tax=Ridgeia piscesae TaxID=27915 RepID=A0AAD9L1S1_RIDPI|nr:hypothetical protein NP493_382g01009 [Ridgeia piscesae]